MKKFFAIIFILSFLTSCAIMEKDDRIVRRSDLFYRFSKSKLNAFSGWKMGDDYLKLRHNNTFLFQARVFGFVHSGYYAGKYTLQNDTLKLTFKNNHKPKVLESGILVLKMRNGEKVLVTNNGYYMSIIKNDFAQN